ncbi:MAG: flagellar biosynthesis protein FlhB [Deltaproteobacteria bacterium]|nr:flagellar biosynthesis protein FlhB [Deltaproteobacteria bacterium]
MAEDNKDQEKTEQATPKRREEAREKGQVAKSRELGSVAVLGACLVYFYFNASSMITQMMDMMKMHFRKAGQLSINIDNVQPMLLDFVFQTFLILIPFLLVALVSGFIANILQVGFLFSSEAIAPKFSKIDPIKGFQRLFSLQSFVELVKNILKMVIVGMVAYLTIKSESDTILPMMNFNVQDIFICIGKVSFKILYTTCWVLVILAVLDYAYQKWEHTKSLNMSKQEVKEEYRQTEGDPLIKGRIKRIQREMARKRMMAAVPKADVVITNPTHLAVALRYEPETMNAPIVLAKGADFLAEKIKEIAIENGIPLVENKVVAQVLYRMVGVEQSIPENLYKAVAEILAYVYSLKQKRVFS